MTTLQRRTFRLYLSLRGRRMTIAGLLWANRRLYLLIFAFFGALGAAAYYALGPQAAAFVGVALGTLFFRDIGYYRRSAALWPALEQVLDWNRVEQLAGGPASIASGKP